jgi:hypothetical protein
MKLREKIERAFSARRRPVRVVTGEQLLQLDSDVEEALWFCGRDWHELTWEDWREHSNAIIFFDREAFAYYLPSLLILSAENPNDSLMAADYVISDLDITPNPEAWTEGLVRRFLGLYPAELDVVKEWLLQICEYQSYKRSGIAGSGPGETLGRAFDTLCLIEMEIRQKRPVRR